MNAPFKQDGRLGRLTTSIGKDALVLLRFDGTDYVNGLFEYSVKALSTQPNTDLDALIGTHASIEIESQNDGAQIFDGIITTARWAGVGENGNRYDLTLRPWLWLAGKRRNQRIFHNKTAVEIIEEVLSTYSGLGKTHLKNQLKSSYDVLEYTVQYRESDLDFICRMMERFGISYHFTHEMSSHTLVLTDTVEEHAALPGGTRPYKPVAGAQQAGEEHFWEWHPERNLSTGAVRLMDYNFKTPMAAMEVDRTGDAVYEQGQIESYDYPGDYLDQGVGKSVVGLRTAQERGQDARHRAVGDCTSLRSGLTVSLTGDQVPGVKDEAYLCLSATHSYVSDAYGSGGADSDGHAYSGSYVLMPATAPLAPARRTAVPVVQGPQTAMVVGEGEIDCDEFGRILVHFHWDLNKAYSMRCRVSQNWASKGWGGMVIPRIGMEVVVEFLEGDPDKPLVTGCVYNGKNDVPYALPEHKTRSTFKTNTHNGIGFNELRFEDEKGIEEIRLHAQTDLNTVVRRDMAELVQRHAVRMVDGNQLEEIGGGLVTNALNGMTFSSGSQGMRETASAGIGAQSNKISDAAKTLRRGKFTQMRPGSLTFVSETDLRAEVGGNSTELVRGSKTLNIGENFRVSADGGLKISVARNALLSAQRTVHINAQDRIKLNVGGTSITIDSNGDISITGRRILLNGSDLIKSRSAKIELN